MRKRRVRWGRVLGALAIGAAAIVLLTGFNATEKKLVETTYTVKEGDTLRSISEAYLPLNTAESRYILEFEHDIIDLNPELYRADYIHPGQKIRINYWVKEGD